MKSKCTLDLIVHVEANIAGCSPHEAKCSHDLLREIYQASIEADIKAMSRIQYPHPL